MINNFNKRACSENYLDFLESEIRRTTDLAKRFHSVNNDFTSAQIWYSVAAAFKISKENAKICADVLISANKRGIDSHGIGRFKTMYYDQLKLGVQSTDVNIEIIKDGKTPCMTSFLVNFRLNY